MTEHNAQRPSLSRLYRRFAGDKTAPVLPEADDLIELSRLPHAEDAASPLVADLLKFARELEPVSAELGAGLAAAAGESAAPAHRRDLPRRAAANGARRRHALAAVAACLIAVVGVWTLQHGRLAPAPVQHDIALAPHDTAPADRIFAANYDQPAVRGDVIFRDKFSAPATAPAPDVVFRSNFNG